MAGNLAALVPTSTSIPNLAELANQKSQREMLMKKESTPSSVNSIEHNVKLVKKAVQSVLHFVG